MFTLYGRQRISDRLENNSAGDLRGLSCGPDECAVRKCGFGWIETDKYRGRQCGNASHINSENMYVYVSVCVYMYVYLCLYINDVCIFIYICTVCFYYHCYLFIYYIFCGGRHTQAKP